MEASVIDNYAGTSIGVSIIVPVYNKEKFIADCIDSLISQSYVSIEIILVDDGSHDKSWDIIKKYSKIDNRIVALHKDNGGVCSARNYGIDNAKGKWISFVDADDSLPVDSIETLCTHAELHNADLIIGNFTRIQGSDKIYVHEYDNEFINSYIWKRIDAGRAWGQLYKSEIIKKHNIHFVDGLAYSEDNVFLTNYSIYVKSLEYIADSIYYYNINSESVTFNPDKIKNAYHQVWAAYETNKLIHTHPEANQFINARTRSLLKAATEGSVKRITDIADLVGVYKNRFKGNHKFSSFFYCTLLKRAVKLFLKLKWL